MNTLLGLFAALEEKIANDDSFDESSVNAIKAAIMGQQAVLEMRCFKLLSS